MVLLLAVVIVLGVCIFGVIHIFILFPITFAPFGSGIPRGAAEVGMPM